MGIVVFLLGSILVVLIAILKAITAQSRPLPSHPEEKELQLDFSVPALTKFSIPDSQVEEESRFADGPKITPAKQRIIDKQMERFLEENPNLGFFQENPHYVDRYLEKIDLSELDDALGKKGE